MNAIQFFILLFVIAFASSCSNPASTTETKIQDKNNTNTVPLKISQNRTKVTLAMKHIAKERLMFDESSADSTAVYHLSFELKNVSKQSITFVSMTCSREDMFIVEDSSLLAIQQSFHCYSNYPVAIQLAPDSVYAKEIMVRSIQNELPNTTTSRMGFQFLEVNPETATFDEIIEKYENRHTTKEIIWSEEIRFEK